MTGIAAVTAVEKPAMNAGYGATVTSLHEQTVGRVRPLLKVLFGAVLFVLLIACANVANLLLMRALGREREMSVRLALGAGRWRLAHQLAVESLLLTGAGGLLGTIAADWGLRALLATLPPGFPLPRIAEIRIDSLVLTFTIGLCAVLGLLFGLVPVFLSGRREPSESLRAGSRSVSSGQRRFRRIMMVTEIAVALVLVIGAGLMVRSFARMRQTDLGFHAEGVLTVRMSLLPGKAQAQAQVIADILRRIRALPGVVYASSINIPPMTSVNSGTWYYRADRPEPDKAHRPGGDVSIVMPDYFRTMGIAVLKGRDFSDQDRYGGPHVGILNKTAARMFFGDEDPLGKRLRVEWNDAGTVEVIGIVADVRHRDPQIRPEPCVFLLNAQVPFGGVSLVARTTSDPRALIPAIKSEIYQVDPDQGVAEIHTMEERVADAGAQPRMQAWLVSAFSLIALALACIGIYGVISYTVSQRTREIGLRVALGADRRRIFAELLGETFSVAAVGVAIGLATSFALTRYLKSLLFEVTPNDPAVYSGVVMLMMIVAIAASWLPARRAAAVDPVVALRDE
jgi:putative ABC transport system permease protein